MSLRGKCFLIPEMNLMNEPDTKKAKFRWLLPVVSVYSRALASEQWTLKFCAKKVTIQPEITEANTVWCIFTPTNTKKKQDFHWLYTNTGIYSNLCEPVASQLVLDASLLFVNLFYFMNQVKFLSKSSPSAALTMNRQTTDTLSTKADVERGWSTEKKVDIPGGDTLENFIMFSGTQRRTWWWIQGDKEKHLPHFPSPGEGPVQSQKRLIML